jgi:hypothetical protein
MIGDGERKCREQMRAVMVLVIQMRPGRLENAEGADCLGILVKSIRNTLRL